MHQLLCFLPTGFSFSYSFPKSLHAGSYFARRIEHTMLYLVHNNLRSLFSSFCLRVFTERPSSQCAIKTRGSQDQAELVINLSFVMDLVVML